MGIFEPCAGFLLPLLSIAALIVVPVAVIDAAVTVALASAVVVVVFVAAVVFVAFVVAGFVELACRTAFHAETSRDSSAGRASD